MSDLVSGTRPPSVVVESDGFAVGLLRSSGVNPVRLPGGVWVNPSLVASVDQDGPEVVEVSGTGWSVRVDPASCPNMDGLSPQGCVDYVAALVWDLDLAEYSDRSL